MNAFDMITDKPDLLIDAGAGVPNSEAWEFTKKFGGRVIGFEPCVERYNDLLQNSYPGQLYNLALSDGSVPKSFYRLHESYNSGFYWDANECCHFVDGKPESQLIFPRELDDFYDEFNSTNAVLWIDVEGAELEILRGAGLVLLKVVKYVVAELRPNPTAPGWCRDTDVDDELRKYGFKMTAWSDPKDPNTLHYDALFVKEGVAGEAM